MQWPSSLYALRAGGFAAHPEPLPRDNKVLKEHYLRYRLWAGGLFALISCAYELSGTECTVMKPRASFARMRLRRYFLLRAPITPIILARPSMFLCKISGDEISCYSIFQYYYSERRIIQYFVPAFFTV